MSHTNENGVRATRKYSKGRCTVTVSATGIELPGYCIISPPQARDLAACLISAADECDQRQEPETPVVPEIPEMPEGAQAYVHIHDGLPGLWVTRTGQPVMFYSCHGTQKKSAHSVDTLENSGRFRRLLPDEARQQFAKMHSKEASCSY